MNRSRGKYDITLDDGTLKMGFTLAHDLTGGKLPGKPAVVNVEMLPGRIDEVVRNADVPRVIENLDAGMGYSRRIEQVPNGYAYCLPGYTRAPGGIFCPAGKLTEITLPPGFTEPIIDSIRFRDHIYLICQSNNILQLSDDGLTASVVGIFPPSFVFRGCAIFNNTLYVGGSDGGLAYVTAAGAWGWVTTVWRSQLAVANWRPQGIPTDVLIGLASDFSWNSVRWCPITADPLVDSNWSAPVRVGGDGDPRYRVETLVSAPRHIYMLRPDGVWDIDELGSRTFNLTPWVREGADHWNGLFGLHIGDGLYYGHSQGLAFVPTGDESAQRAPEWAHPGWGLPYEGPVRGMALAGTLHQGWGLVGQWSDTSPESYVSAGRRSQAAYGNASHIWHGAEAVVPGGVRHMKVHTLDWESGWPQLLITSVGPGTESRAYWQSLSRTGTPLQEMLWGGQFEPADSASLFLPSDPWNRPSTVKSLLQVEMVTERLNIGSDVLKVYADADGAGTWDEQGTAEDGTYTELAPLELTEGRFLSTRIDAIGSPILRSIELRAAMGIRLREARVYRVILGYDNALKTPRGREGRDPQQRMADLQTMLGRVVTLEDEWPMRVRVLQVMTPERHQLGSPNRAGAWALVVPIMVSILDQPYRYDASARYDTDRTWG